MLDGLQTMPDKFDEAKVSFVEGYHAAHRDLIERMSKNGEYSDEFRVRHHALVAWRKYQLRRHRV